MINFYINYPKWVTPYVIKGVEFLRWYSIMYIVAFIVTFLFFRKLLKRGEMNLNLDYRQGEDLDMLIWVALAGIIGGRLGSCLLYSGSYYWKNPHLIFWPFSGGQFVGLPGMSFHGGIIGVCLGILILSKIKRTNFFNISDPILISFPFAYFFGRLGNFFNAELYGKVTSSPFGMVFSDAHRFSTSQTWVQDMCNKIGMSADSGLVNLPRHPSMLYEAFFEGIILGAIMWFIVRPNLKKIKLGVPSGIFLVLYGAIRFVIEYFRQPDENLGYIIKLGPGSENIYKFTSLANFSLGQILCFVTILAGVFIIICCNHFSKILALEDSADSSKKHTYNKNSASHSKKNKKKKRKM